MEFEKKEMLMVEYINTILKLKLFPSSKNFNFFFKSTYGDIDFRDKKILDIGGGYGLVSFFAAINGAKKVVCLEPEIDGSTSGVKHKFSVIHNKLGLNNVSLISKTFQDYQTTEKYDIIILHNTINHLNEDMCELLVNSKEAQVVYKTYFEKMHQLTSCNAIIVVTDCSSKNFFNDLGMKSPIMPTIEWKKHQSPYFWLSLMNQTGFRKIKLKWTTFNRFGNTGRRILANRFMSYFLQNHFCLIVRKVNY